MVTVAIDELGVRIGWTDDLRALRREGNAFIASEPASAGPRLFGGLVAAQAMAAACATVPATKLPQSLHAYFVRGGRTGVDLRLEVANTRDGRSFATRRVTGVQDGQVAFEMLASFHEPEAGVDLHPPAPTMPSVDESHPGSFPNSLNARFELRTPTYEPTFSGPPYWVRVREVVDNDPITRACVLTYMSDLGLMAAARPPDTKVDMEADEPRLGRRAASLDHAVWFHRPFEPNDWHLYVADSLNNNDARGLVRGSFYNTDGLLIASTAQEALWRM